MENFSGNFPDNFPLYLSIKFEEFSRLLRDHYAIDFSQPIDRLDAGQLYASGAFLLVSCFVLIVLTHYFVYYFISNPLATIIFAPASTKKKSTGSKKLTGSALPSTPPQPQSTKVGAKIKLKTTPYTKSLADLSDKKAQENIIKFNIAFWKAVNYGCLFLYGVYFCFFLEKDAWIYDYERFVIPLRFYSWPIAIYYHLSLAHYLYGLICLLVEPKLKDFAQMVVHHFVTLGLEFGSYYYSG